MENGGYIKELYKGFSHFVIFLLSFILAFITSSITKIIISPGDTYSVLNVHSAGGFSPEQNFAKLIVIIVMTVIYYKILHRLFLRKPLYFKAIILSIALFFVSIISILPMSNGYKQNIDMFHIGEQLSPSQDYNNGKNLYEDMFVLHGVGEDILIPALALRISDGTNGIGYHFFIRALLMIISAGLFLTLLFKLFKDPLTYMLIVTWFLLGAYSQFYYVRDIFTWSALLLVFYIFNNSTREKYKYFYAYAALGVISSLSIFYSFDRGVIALLLAVLVATSSIFISRDLSGKIRLSLPKIWKRFINFGLTILGILSVQLAGLVIIGGDAYREFIQTYFSDIPKYQGLLFNYPLPEINERTLSIWLPFILASMALIGVYNLVRDGIANKFWDQKLFIAISMIVVGIVFLRIGYGRSDPAHIAYSTPLLFVSIFYTLQIYIQKNGIKPYQFWLPASILLMLFIPQTTLNIDKAASIANINPVKT